MNIIMFKIVARKLWIWELLVIIALILFLSSCSSNPQATEIEETIDLPTVSATAKPTKTTEPSPTPLPTSTPTSRPTDTPAPAPTSTATPDMQATAAAEATQIVDEKISGIQTDIEGVGFLSDTGKLGWVQSQPYKIVVDEYDGSYFETFADDLVAADFILNTDITWESSSGFAGCGLLFRSEANFKQGAQYEIAFIRLSGLPAWEIAYRKDDEFQKSVTGILTAGAINQEQGSTNSYMLVAEAGKFTLYINDVRIGSYYDYANSQLEGGFAFTGWQESGETSCEFSDTWIWLFE